MTTLTLALKNFDTNIITLEQGIELSTLAKMLRSGYEHHTVTVPIWLTDAERKLTRFIGDLTADRLELELRELDALDADSLTAGEKRQARQKRRDEIQAKLGKQPTTA